MFASEFMTSLVYVVGPEDNLSHVRNEMLKHKISRCPVMDGGTLVGIITKKDLAWRLRQTEPVWRRRPIDHIPVRVVMETDLVTISGESDLHECASLMVEHDISGLPVIEEGDIVGIVTKSDILNSEYVSDLSLSVDDLMGPAETLSRYHSLDHVIDIMSDQNGKIVVVNNDGTLAGIITESNVALFTYANKRTALPGRDVTFLRKNESAGRKQNRYVMDVVAVAEDVMSRPVITIGSEAIVSDAVRLMIEHHINSIVVTDDGDLKGIISRDDIIQEVAK